MSTDNNNEARHAIANTGKTDQDSKLNQEPVSLIKVLNHEENLLRSELREEDRNKIESGDELTEEFEAKRCSDFHDRERSALCLSGGGIRSATFSLGVLQGLARTGVLKKFDFLSTVSGGGFIGSWLSRWIHENGDSKAVTKELASDTPNVPAIKNLREYSNYLSPQKGMTQDAFTLAAIYMRNLFLNWLVLIPLLIAVVLVPRLFNMLFARSLTSDFSEIGAAALVSSLIVLLLWYLIRHVFLHRTVRAATYKIGALPLVVAIVLCCTTILNWTFSNCEKGYLSETKCLVSTLDMATYSTLSVPALLIGIALVYGFVQGLGSIKFSEAARERASRDIAALLTVAFGWLILFAVVLLGPIALLTLLQKAPYLVASAGGIAGVGAAVLGYFGSRGASEPSENGSTVRAKLKRHLMPILATVFLVLLGTSVSLGSSVAFDKWLWSGKNNSVVRSMPAPPANPKYLNEWFTDVDDFVTKSVSDGKAETTAGTPGETETKNVHITMGESKTVSEKTTIESVQSNLPPNSQAIQEAAQSLKIRGSREALLKIEGPKTPGFEILESLKNRHKEQLIRRLPDSQSDASQAPEASWKPRIDGAVILWIILALLIAIACGLSRFFGANRFSLHAMYENRLVRAYLAAARKDRPQQDPSTGFDPADDLAMASLTTSRPLHIVNATLNVAGGSDKARQSRKGASFTFSKLHSGSEITGFQPSSDYADDVHMEKESGITLGKAMSISGAAVSPAMGYHSSKLVGAVLAFFNARLGWWLPNPGKAGKDVWNRSEPKVGIMPLIRELTGRADDQSAYVYVSDGGHFENLGLYEMVRRRCRYIVVVDAGQDVDNQYESLSTAIRMIRVDFGIDITFDADTGPRSGRKMEKHYSIGRIGYSAVDGDSNNTDAEDGVIIYIKPVLTGDEPIDLAHYAKIRLEAGASFPQETTADQFFDEAQFESYRKLGLASVEAMADDLKDIGNIEVPDAKILAARKKVRPDENEIRVTKEENDENSVGALVDTAGTFAGLIAPASTWIGPAVASTIAASAVVAFTVTVVAPEDIALKAPEDPIVLQMPKECKTDAATGETICGNLDVGDVTVQGGGPSNASLTLSEEDRQLLKRLMREPQEGQPDDGNVPGGIALTNEAERILKVAIGDSNVTTTNNTTTVVQDNSSQSGLVLSDTALTALGNAVNRDEGVKINREDLLVLQNIVAEMRRVNIATQLEGIDNSVKGVNFTTTEVRDLLRENLGPLGTESEGLNRTMKDIESRISDGFDGLRNDSGGSQ